jgi:hypothetical protein
MTHYAMGCLVQFQNVTAYALGIYGHFCWTFSSSPLSLSLSLSLSLLIKGLHEKIPQFKLKVSQMALGI